MSEPPTVPSSVPVPESKQLPYELSTEERAESHDDDINLIDFAVVLAKYKWMILVLPVIAAMCAVIYSVNLPNIYTANTKILPPQQSQSTASAMLTQLGNLAGVTLGKAAGNELFIAMLRSRTMADNLIRRFGLLKPDEKYPSRVREAILGATVVTSGKDGVINIEVSDADPKYAADLANAYVDELNKMTSVLAVTEASVRRLFFERQLGQANDRLAKAEFAVKVALERGGIAQVEGQGRAMLEATARLRGEITVKEIQISAMRTFAAEGNPDLYRAQQELESTKRELAKIEGFGRIKGVPVGEKGQGMDNMRLLRDLRYYENIYEMLAKQYEMAKIDESKDAAVIQVLDKAIEPDVKSKPNRRNIVVLWTLAALLAAILLAFVREAVAKARSDPKQTIRLRALKHYVSGR